jgi:hypothetical protein
MNPVELQTAIYSRLNHSSVTAMLTAGYGLPAIFSEWAPQVNDSGDPAFFPFVTFSFPSSSEYDDKGDEGQNSVVQVDVWSRVGTVEVKMIAAAVRARLHRQDLAVTGHITTQCEAMDFSRDPDGVTRRGLLSFRVLALASGEVPDLYQTFIPLGSDSLITADNLTFRVEA